MAASQGGPRPGPGALTSRSGSLPGTGTASDEQPGHVRPNEAPPNKAPSSAAQSDEALPGDPLPAPEARALPSDVVTLDGPVPGNPLELMPRLRAALSRPGPAVVVATSGSTGRPKKTVLSTQALTASGRATERATAGPGQWLLCLPTHYVAGIQVLARSVLAGTRPVAMPTEHFTPAAFADAAQRLTHPVRYVSVVPTQLQRILDPRDGAPDPRAVAALARFDAVLVGGSALSPDLALRAADAGVRVVRTYGMSETCGGCVYDDAALDAVTAGIVPDGAPSSAIPAPNERREGRIWLGGAAVADGYLDDPAQTADHFRVIDGVRWYRTDDLGVLREDGTLRVLGRTDDVINTGGVKVSAGLVAVELQRDERVRQALVLAVPHPEWGQAVAAVIALREGSDHPAVERELSSSIRDELGAPAVPKLWRHVAQLPILATGKPDRRAAEALFASPDA